MCETNSGFMLPEYVAAFCMIYTRTEESGFVRYAGSADDGAPREVPRISIFAPANGQPKSGDGPQPFAMLTFVAASVWCPPSRSEATKPFLKNIF